MGAIADAIVTYAQPLLDETDGSIEAMNRALSMGQLCWNLALLPDDSQERTLSKMRSSLDMTADEFDEFRQTVITPMISRHREMFPLLHRRRSTRVWEADDSESGPAFWARPETTPRVEKYPGTDRYAPCPCNSGRKYKFCCGSKSR